MVRFQWLVEDGCGALVPPYGVVQHKDSGVQHATCEIELSGQSNTVEACLTLPKGSFLENGTKEVGIILGHGERADEWKGRFMTDIAVALARSGYLVMRYYCKQKEQRRLRLFEKALDVCATSPFARHVSRWVLAGVGNGARIAASVGTRCRGVISGLVLLSYPLLEPAPNSKGPPAADSIGPLLKLTSPMLFITTDRDDLAPEGELRKACARMNAKDVRVFTLKGLDSNFKVPNSRAPPSTSTTAKVINCLLEFIDAINNNHLEGECPGLTRVPTATSGPVAVPSSQPSAEKAPGKMSSIPNAGTPASGSGRPPRPPGTPPSGSRKMSSVGQAPVSVAPSSRPQSGSKMLKPSLTSGHKGRSEKEANDDLAPAKPLPGPPQPLGNTPQGDEGAAGFSGRGTNKRRDDWELQEAGPSRKVPRVIDGSAAPVVLQRRKPVREEDVGYLGSGQPPVPARHVKDAHIVFGGGGESAKDDQEEDNSGLVSLPPSLGWSQQTQANIAGSGGAPREVPSQKGIRPPPASQPQVRPGGGWTPTAGTHPSTTPQSSKVPPPGQQSSMTNAVPAATVSHPPAFAHSPGLNELSGPSTSRNPTTSVNVMAPPVPQQHLAAPMPPTIVSQGPSQIGSGVCPSPRGQFGVPESAPSSVYPFMKTPTYPEYSYLSKWPQREVPGQALFRIPGPAPVGPTSGSFDILPPTYLAPGANDGPQGTPTLAGLWDTSSRPLPQVSQDSSLQRNRPHFFNIPPPDH